MFQEIHKSLQQIKFIDLHVRGLHCMTEKNFKKNLAERHRSAVPETRGHGDVRAIAGVQRRIRGRDESDLRLATA